MSIRIPPLVLTGLAIAACWLATRLHPSFTFHVTTAARVLALALFAAGLALGLAGARAFHRAQTTVNPLVPESASSLVTDGVYRYSRNPMYLGFLLLLLAAGTALGSWLGMVVTAPLLAAYLTRWQILPEESALEQKFGERWHAYRRRTRRWL